MQFSKKKTRSGLTVLQFRVLHYFYNIGKYSGHLSTLAEKFSVSIGSFHRVIDFLVDAGYLVVEKPKARTFVISITDKGIEFIHKHSKKEA